MSLADPNLYWYCGNDPVNAFDDGMRGDTKRQGNSSRKSSFVAHRKIAFIAVGDIKDKW